LFTVRRHAVVRQGLRMRFECTCRCAARSRVRGSSVWSLRWCLHTHAWRAHGRRPGRKVGAWRRRAKPPSPSRRSYAGAEPEHRLVARGTPARVAEPLPGPAGAAQELEAAAPPSPSPPADSALPVRRVATSVALWNPLNLTNMDSIYLLQYDMNVPIWIR